MISFQLLFSIPECFRYKHERLNIVSKISTKVSTGRIQNGNIVAQLFGKQYLLKSVVLHIGNGVEAGHYTAITQEKEKWWFCNDGIVNCHEKYFEQAYKSGNSYLLLYQHADQ